MERTLIILKPDAVQRKLVGEIVGRFEDKGLQIVACKMMRIGRELAQRHYGVHKDKPFFDSLIGYITSGPVLVVVLQGPGCIAIARKLMGQTFGCQADPGTIRGDYGASRSFNLVHGSDSAESAATEMELFFSSEEIMDYSFSDAAWIQGNG